MRTTRWARALVAALALCAVQAVTTTTDGAAAAPAAAPAAEAPAVLRITPKTGVDDDKYKNHVSLGVQFHGMWQNYTDDQRREALRKLAAMGATWVRIDIGWSMLQPERGPIDPNSWGADFIDRVVRMAHSYGLKVLGTLWLTPGWANNNAGQRVLPDDPQDYADALSWAAERWRGVVQAWEVWNEPNSGDFMVGANPNAYTRLLCNAYRTVRNNNGADGVRVVFGGTMHNDVPWIQQTYNAGVKGCYDVMAVHPYQVPGDTSPKVGDGSQVWEFEHLGALRQLMKARGDDSPVWATEIGWSSHPNNPGDPAWARGVTQKQQARYSVMALDMLDRKYKFVRKVFFYTERANPGEGVHQAGYGLMTSDLRAKPVYGALQRWSRR